ncbi:hypothetical protein HQN87_20165 [Paenibacillus tritici]|uniref:Extracellular solute-binding protein n=1 Tax=Paenibacillus tritici TaxID=1873425 RepID=A0ABX2DU14_9BACL|nr:hypothetical protein [Paenibacillus tritici]NQX47642.1 hypothetical protein [Paenibacillus tritici]
MSCSSSGANSPQGTEATAKTEGSASAVELRMTWWGSQTRHDLTTKMIKRSEEKNPGITIKHRAQPGGISEALTGKPQHAGHPLLCYCSPQGEYSIFLWRHKRTFSLPVMMRCGDRRSIPRS